MQPTRCYAMLPFYFQIIHQLAGLSTPKSQKSPYRRSRRAGNPLIARKPLNPLPRLAQKTRGRPRAPSAHHKPQQKRRYTPIHLQKNTITPAWTFSFGCFFFFHPFQFPSAVGFPNHRLHNTANLRKRQPNRMSRIRHSKTNLPCGAYTAKQHCRNSMLVSVGNAFIARWHRTRTARRE